MPGKAQGRLLIIEDDNELNDMLSTYFEMQGYEVYHALTGTDGVALARQKLPHLVLLDVMLPDLDGFDVFRELRTTNRTRYIPVTFLTQKDDRRDRVTGLEMGADDYITKPFDLEELRLRVRRAMTRVTRDLLIDPRTGLPGPELIADRLKELNQSHPGWTYVEGRVEHMDGFRERYGFVVADEVMAFAARKLIDGVAEFGTDEDFIGHIRGANFAIITYLESPHDLTETVEDIFNQEVLAFYNFEERDKGYIQYENANGETIEMPLMQLCLQTTDLPPEITERIG